MTTDIEELSPPLRGKLLLKEVAGATLVKLGDRGRFGAGGRLLSSTFWNSEAV